MRWSRCAAFASLFLFPLAAAAESIVESSGRVTAVTVYQGQALVTREVELPGDEGLVEVVVGDLPERIVPGSLYAEPGEGVEVRSVRYRVRPVESDNRAEVRELNEQIGEVEYQLAKLKRERALLAERARYLTSLEGFTAGTATTELTSGVLDADTLKKLTLMVFDERDKIADRELEIQREQKELSERLNLLRRELGVITSGASKSRREAVAFVDVRRGGEASLRLTYLVSGATWSPSYNLRADGDRSEVVVEYNASVEQTSGEDWTDVAMTLSTATPSLVAKAPELSPLGIRLVSAKPKAGRESKLELDRRQRALASNRGNFAFFGDMAGELSSSAPALQGNLEAIEEAELFGFDVPRSGGLGGGGGGFGGAYVGNGLDVKKLDAVINTYACASQVMDFTSRNGGTPVAPEPETNEGLSVVYRLRNRTSLPSRPDRQLIAIAKLPIEAEFYRVATPLLTSYVYEEARLTNGSDLVLLGGPSATFVGDRFVGRGEVPSAAVGESFTVGLGIDESLRARRELVDRTERVQGGNRVVRFDYRLTVENFGGEAAAVRLFDRLPRTTGSDIKVTLVDSSPEIVDDDQDADRREKQGLVRWDVEAPGRDGVSGEVVADYTLEIEHDKNLTIAGLPTKR